MFKRSVIAMACIFALSACGGGGGGSPDVKSADTLSKPAAPVVSEKETEAKEDAPQAGSQGQGAPSAQGSQDMAAVSEENTGNGGAVTADNPKNEDEVAQNDMPQNAAGTDSSTPNHTPDPNMLAGNMENQATDAGESSQPANQPDMANAADGMQGDDPSAGGQNAGNTAAQGANQAGNNQAAGSSDPIPAFFRRQYPCEHGIGEKAGFARRHLLHLHSIGCNHQYGRCGNHHYRFGDGCGAHARHYG